MASQTCIASLAAWQAFASRSRSGTGRETGIESLAQFTEPRTITGFTLDGHKDDGVAKRLN